MSTSESLLNEILLKINKVRKLKFFQKDLEEIDLETLKQNIGHLIMQLYDTSIEDNFYYLDCPIEVYENTYNLRFNEVCQIFRGTTEVFFLKSELEDLILGKYSYSKTNLQDFRNYCQNTFYNTSFHSKTEYIRGKLLSLCHIVNITPEVYKIPGFSMYANGIYTNIDYTFDPSVMSKVEVPSKDDKERLVWIGNASHLGFIIGTLIDKGFIKAPTHKSGDINYTKLASLVKQSFINDSKDTTLSKYLNLNSEKSHEAKRVLEECGFLIPDIIEVSKSLGKKSASTN
jgi:hypothetical protein